VYPTPVVIPADAALIAAEVAILIVTRY